MSPLSTTLNGTDSMAGVHAVLHNAENTAINALQAIVPPTLTSGQVLVGSGTATLIQDAGLSWDNSTKTLTATHIASPILTGTPTAPTATVGTNTTQIATTAYVLANGGSGGGATSNINIYEATAQSGTTITLGSVPGVGGIKAVMINGQALIATRDWTASGAVITLTTAMVSDDVHVEYLDTPVFTGSIPVGGDLAGTLPNPTLGTIAGNIVMSSAASKIVPGATSLSFRNSGNSADNLLISDSGVVTARAGLTVTAGQVLAPNGLAAAPSLGFSNSPGTGFMSIPMNQVVLVSGGTNLLSTATFVFRLHASLPLSWSSGDPTVAGSDTILLRDAPNTLALRNGTTAQTLRLYANYVDGSNYDRLTFGLSGTSLAMQTESAGTGTARALVIGPVGLAPVIFQSNNIPRWQVNGNGHFAPWTDNLFDIGLPTSIRVRNIYQAGGTFQSYNPGAGIANDGTNYERGELSWSGNTLSLLTLAGGTGVIRDCTIGTAGLASFYIKTNGTTRWGVNPIGNLFPIGNTIINASGGAATKVKAGTPVDGDFSAAPDGLIAIDSTASRIWVRVGGVWKYAALN